MTTTQDSPTAAGSGANASDAFKASKERRGAAAVAPERVDAVVSAVLGGVHAAPSRAQGQLSRVPGRQGLADGGRRNRRVAAVHGRLRRARHRGGRGGTAARHQGLHRRPVLPTRPGQARLDLRPSASRRREGHPAGVRGSGPRPSTVLRSAVPRSTSGMPMPTATTPASRRICRMATCAVSSSPTRKGGSRSRRSSPRRTRSRPTVRPAS